MGLAYLLDTMYMYISAISECGVFAMKSLIASYIWLRPEPVFQYGTKIFDISRFFLFQFLISETLVTSVFPMTT